MIFSTDLRQEDIEPKSDHDLLRIIGTEIYLYGIGNEYADIYRENAVLCMREYLKRIDGQSTQEAEKT